MSEQAASGGRRRPFRQVDVFTATPYLGNPVAVVLEAEGLSTEQMQRLSSWTNLSEATFLLPPSDPRADYRVRIFSGARELPFAGHPTLGTCHAWLEAGGSPGRPDTVVQECEAGLVAVRRDEGRLAFAAPPLVRSGPVEETLLERVIGVLGVEREEVVDAAWVDNGPGWIGVLLESAERVLELSPAPSDLEIGVAGLHAEGSPYALELRAFFSKDGVATEDPVTGSLNASVAEWLLDAGRVGAPYVARQGTAIGRDGRVHVSRDDEAIWVGGEVVTCIAGEVALG